MLIIIWKREYDKLKRLRKELERRLLSVQGKYGKLKQMFRTLRQLLDETAQQLEDERQIVTNLAKELEDERQKVADLTIFIFDCQMYGMYFYAKAEKLEKEKGELIQSLHGRDLMLKNEGEVLQSQAIEIEMLETDKKRLQKKLLEANDANACLKEELRAERERHREYVRAVGDAVRKIEAAGVA